MFDLLNYLKIKRNKDIWLEDKNKKLLLDNPFHFENNRLYDKNEALRDDILGRFVREDVLVSIQESLAPAYNENYYFLNENLDIKHRKNEKKLIDIFNIMIGNFYISRKKINKSEKERIKSLFDMLLFENKSLFPYPIIEKDNFFQKIRELNSEEKDKKNIIDKSALPDSEDCNGMLRIIFENNQKEII